MVFFWGVFFSEKNASCINSNLSKLFFDEKLAQALSLNTRRYLLLRIAPLFSEEVGFEPTDPCRPPVFKTGAIGHSATLPH